jgi:hypothetical protein
MKIAMLLSITVACCLALLAALCKYVKCGVKTGGIYDTAMRVVFQYKTALDLLLIHLVIFGS